VRKTGLGKGVVRLSLVPVVTEVFTRRWDKTVKTGVWFANARKNDLEMLLRLVANDSSSATNRTLG